MTYSSGGPGYPGAQQSGAYAPTSQLAKVDEGPSKLPSYLLGGVTILGLAAYLLSYGPLWKSGQFSDAPTLGIIAVLFASLFAVVALLPKQANYAAVVTVTAAVGFLLTIWALINGSGTAGWALIGIVILSALQTVVAIGALLLDAGVISPPAPRPKYDPYQPHPGAYYGQPQFTGPPSGPPGPPTPGPQGPPAPGPRGFGQPHGMPQGMPQYGGYPGGGPTGGFPPQGQQVGPPTPPTGFPTYAPPPSAPAGGAPTEQVPVPQQPPSAQEAPTEQVPAPQQSASPSSPPPS
jgi:Family of unknown function (DUF5336)